MAKSSGGTRMVRPTSNTRTQNYQVYRNDLKSPDVNAAESYFSKAKGGYVIAMNGSKHSSEEHDAARAMADDGLIVTLTPEGGVQFRTGKNKDGGYTYADGLVKGWTYEQATKHPKKLDAQSLAKSVDGALKHAYDKRAQIPLIYDKYGVFHRQNIEDGLKRFEERNKYRFKAILVVDQKGNVWEHRHNE